MGYFAEGQVYGKYCEVDLINNRIWAEPGLYNTRTKCLKREIITDFLEPKAPPKQVITMEQKAAKMKEEFEKKSSFSMSVDRHRNSLKYDSVYKKD